MVIKGGFGGDLGWFRWWFMVVWWWFRVVWWWLKLDLVVFRVVWWCFMMVQGGFGDELRWFGGGLG